VLNVVQNMPNRSLHFFINSNKPNNRPMNQSKNCDWGGYIIYKQTAHENSGTIIYIETNIIVKYDFDAATQSLNW
jgi:hypothetical protein